MGKITSNLFYYKPLDMLVEIGKDEFGFYMKVDNGNKLGLSINKVITSPKWEYIGHI